jgi:peptide/nickel transport system ATP-binding protein
MFSTAEQTLLEVINLEVKFHGSDKETFALNNISFKLNRGESLGIVGESGSGKSVMMLSVLGLLNNLETNFPKGEVLFFQENSTVDLLKLEEKELRKIRGKGISMVFQEPMTSFNPVKKIGHQVAEILEIHEQLSFNEARLKTIEFFEEVKLPNPEVLFERYPHELSGGQKQRAMIAMAIACKPQLLIADEPTTALDVTVQKEIILLLKKLAQKYRMGLIFISHDLALVGECTSKLLVMYKGKLLESGYTHEILQQPKVEYTRALLKCRPSVNLSLERLPVISDFITTEKKEKEISTKTYQTTHTLKELVLKADNLDIHYPNNSSFFSKKNQSIAAVKSISFDLFSKETLCVVGESGSGKTTVAKAITGLLPIYSGTIELFENTYSNKNQLKYNSKVQMVFQDPYSSLNPVLKIGNCIVEAIQVNKIFLDKKSQLDYAYWLLNKVGLNDEAFDKFPHQFSGGQRQRIVIARALSCKPKLLICDEAVAALDVSVQAQVLNLLKDLQEEFGFANLFITHDLNVAKFISQKVLVMKNGEMIEYGNTNEILENPKNSYTMKLIEAVPVL